MVVRDGGVWWWVAVAAAIIGVDMLSAESSMADKESRNVIVTVVTFHICLIWVSAL